MTKLLEQASLTKDRNKKTQGITRRRVSCTKPNDFF